MLRGVSTEKGVGVMVAAYLAIITVLILAIGVTLMVLFITTRDLVLVIEELNERVRVLERRHIAYDEGESWHC